MYAEHITQNARPDESQPGIKTMGRNINHLRYADDTTLVAESEEELKSLLMRVKNESEKAGSTFKRHSKNPSTFKKLRSWHPVPSLQS